jgi:hypothetical protein
MSAPAVVDLILVVAVACCILSSLTRRAGRPAAAAAVALLAVAFLVGWSDDRSPLDRPVTVLAAILAVAGGGLVTTQVFALVEEPDRVRRAGAVLRGGAWIGALERIGVFVAVVTGWGAGVAIVLAVKGLGRYPELRSQDDSGVAERFIIGTFVSVLWAVGCAGVAVLT